MSLIESFIRNPVKVSVGILLVALFGTISAISMPKQLTPEVENPVITIETRWPGASPQEIEREIIQEQEEQLKSVEGVIKLSSESKDSVGEVILEFAVGTDIDDATLKVNTRLQQVPEYPIDADEPVITTSSASDRPIARYVLTGRPPTKEQVAAFQDKHPELAEPLDHVLLAMNPGLMVFRLQELYEEKGDEHPELAELLPPDIDVRAMRKFIEDVIEARFERVPGVSNADVYGGVEEELQVVVDPIKLAARGLTITDVRAALRGQNQDTSGGDFWEGKRRWVIRTLGQFRDTEQVEKQLLTIQDGAPVYVGDVAEVRVGYKKPDSISRRYGLSATGLSVSRETGANVLEVMEGLRAATRELNEGILKHRQLELYQYYDETDYIHSAINLVQQNIFVGSALTMIVLMLFLHRGMRALLVTPFIAATAVAAAYLSPWYFVLCLLVIVGAGFWFARGALVVGLAIPTSIVGTFLLLGLMGRSLNVISLAGMAFAVGMLVDNAVVVLENIHRRCHLGESAFQAAVRGTQEVWGAVVASTLTTIAVFLPVVFIDEMAGQLFRDIALAITCAVGLSLVVSFTLIPTASARLYNNNAMSAPALRDAVHGPSQLADTPSLKSNGNGHHPENGNGHSTASPTPQRHRPAQSRNIQTTRKAGQLGSTLLRFFDQVGGTGVGAIVGLNQWILRSRIRAIATVGTMVGVAIFLSYSFWPKVEYLPQGNRNFIFATLSPPPGYNLDQLMEMGIKIERDLQPYWDVNPGTPEAAQLKYPVIDYYFFVVRGRRVIMGARSADPSRTHELMPLLREIGSQFPGTLAVAKRSSLFERGISGGRTVDIEIQGPDLERLVKLGGKVLADVHRLMPDAQALPRPSLDLSSPEIHLEPKLVQTAEMGVTAVDLGYTVDALVDGAYAGDYFVGGDKIDLTIIGNENFVKQTQDINSLPVATPGGQLVPLAALADIRLSSGPEQINHRERLRAITIQVTPPAAMPLEEAVQLIDREIHQPLLDSGDLEGGYQIVLSGTADKLRETWEALRWNVLLALAITYLLMAALFESWLYPFVIIFSVPLGAVGGLVGLRLLNVFILQPLDVLTMLGFVILIGTVVNNAILIVHQSLNHIRFDGMSPREAIPESVRTRIRPIFITTLTTVLGLLPLVLFPGAGSELYRGIGSVVLGGLLVSTIFTLVLVPTVFILTMDAKAFIVGQFQRISPNTPDTTPVEEREPVAAS